jgi:hypothetical protein
VSYWFRARLPDLFTCILRGRGRVKVAVCQVLFFSLACCGRDGIASWPWGPGVEVCLFPIAAVPAEWPGVSRTGRRPAARSGAADVLDVSGHDPIIGVGTGL